MFQVLTNNEAMLWALKEAKKGEGFVAPNPLVGCCILDKDNRLLSVGAHLKLGENHAEIAALEKVEDRKALKGAKVFVTLEPCSKQGRTPSCAKTLGELPIAEVHYACPDPNPQMAGGAQILREAGKSVFHSQEFQDQAELLTEVFLLNQRQKRCFFHLKVGSSLDGLITDSSGESQWITGEESRYEVQRLRGITDGVLVGRGTFESDNPRLQSRHAGFEEKSNCAIVLDPDGKLVKKVLASNLAKVRSLEKIILVTSESVTLDYTQELSHIAAPETISGELDLDFVGKSLYQMGLCSVLVEGGAITYSRFFRQGLADRLTMFLSTSLMGAFGAKHWLSQYETMNLDERAHLLHVETHMYGKDICITGCPRNIH